ncbi:MAG: sulfotransferase, partial [Pseudomonadota bacterium]|nr:sulfotransferase [Pseudomonadota bacterium]
IYERLVDDPDAQIRTLLEACGLPFDPACLAFHKTERAIRTPSSEQVRQPIYRDALDEWRAYEPWLGPLVEALGPVANAYPDSPRDF